MADDELRRERLEAPVSVQMRGSERGRVRRAAYLSDQSVSAFIREAAVKAADRVLDRMKKAAA